MKPHSVVMRTSSAALNVASVNAVSVTPNVVAGEPGVTGRAWSVVPQAARPVASKFVPVPTVDALQDFIGRAVCGMPLFG